MPNQPRTSVFGPVGLPAELEEPEPENREPEAEGGGEQAPGQSPEPAQTQQPEAGAEPSPQQQQLPTEAAPAGQPEGGTEPPGQGEGDGLILGRFRSQDDLATAYQQAEQWGTRSAQEAAAARREVDELRQAQAEQTAILQQLIPALVQQQAQDNPEMAERLQRYAEVQPLIEQSVGQIRQEVERSASEREMRSVIDDFYRAHEDAREPQADQAITEFMRRMKLQVGNRDALEVAYEAYKDPALAQVLTAIPALAESDAGMHMARAWVRAQGGPQPQGNVQQKTPAQVQKVVSESFVESPQTGSPTPGAPGGFDFGEVIEAARDLRGSRFTGAT